MADEGFKRKLTAILNADVVGYSLLMDDNEEATIQTLNSCRNSMTTLIEQLRGRVSELKKCLKLRPNNIIAYRHLSITYALAGRYEEARETWSEVLKLDPKISYKKTHKRCPYPPESCERNKAAMNKAGIK
jgi:tetratricopeptide (TPR) repeat protein